MAFGRRIVIIIFWWWERYFYGVSLTKKASLSLNWWVKKTSSWGGGNILMNKKRQMAIECWVNECKKLQSQMSGNKENESETDSHVMMKGWIKLFIVNGIALHKCFWKALFSVLTTRHTIRNISPYPRVSKINLRDAWEVILYCR